MYNKIEQKRGEKEQILFIIVYFILAVGLILSIFMDFLKANLFSVSVSSIFVLGDGKLNAGATFGIVLFGGMALIAIFEVVSKIICFVKKCDNTKKLDIVLILASLVLFFVCYPSFLSVQIHLTNFYVGASITVFFVLAIVLPLLFCVLLMADKRSLIKKELLSGVGAKTVYPTTFIYPVLALLALVAFCLPVYSYEYVGEIQRVFTGTLSLYGAGLHESLACHRTALFVLVGALAAVAMFVANLGVVSSNNNGEWAKNKAYKTARMAICIIMLVITIYCLPSVLNFMTQCRQNLDGLPEGIYSDAKLGVSYYAMLALPVLIAFCSVFDGSNEFLKAKPANKKKKRIESKNWEICRSVFKAIYIVILLIILLTFALPYAQYGLYDVSGVDFFSYITYYSGVERGYINGMPATNDMFTYAILTAILAVISLVAMHVGGKSRSKRTTIFSVSAKTFSMIAFICLFAWMNPSISFYHQKFIEVAQMTDSYLAFGITGDLLSVVTIGYLIVVCIDFVIYGYKFLQKRRK